MSDFRNRPTDTNILAQRLQSAEKSIEFIQREHASTLTNLHEEISKWQQKCSDLTFQLAIGGATVIKSADESKLRSTIEQLEKEIHQYKQSVGDLNQLLEEKEHRIRDYQNQLIVNERRHVLELRSETDKQQQLKTELEQRSTLIAQLTYQLHREKQSQQKSQARARLGHMILPNKPVMLPSTAGTEQQQQRQRSASARWSSRARSPSVSGRRASPDQDTSSAIVIKRRPPTPPQQLRPLSLQTVESNDDQFYTKRQRQLLNSHAEKMDSNKVVSGRPPIKLSTTLPPIINRNMPLKALATTTIPQEGEV